MNKTTQKALTALMEERAEDKVVNVFKDIFKFNSNNEIIGFNENAVDYYYWLSKKPKSDIKPC